MIASTLGAFLAPEIGWRGLFVVGLLPALFTLVIRAWVPESPHWSCARAPGRRRRPRPRQHRPRRGPARQSSASATTTPLPSASPITGCGTGTRETTPATRWAAGCAAIRNRSSCSPATSPWTGPITSPSAGAKAAKRHQAVSGYWHSLATLARWCRIRQLPGLRRRPRHHSPRRHPSSHRRQTLATTAPRPELTP